MYKYLRAKTGKLLCILLMALFFHGIFMIISIIQLTSENSSHYSTKPDDNEDLESRWLTNESSRKPEIPPYYTPQISGKQDDTEHYKHRPSVGAHDNPDMKRKNSDNGSNHINISLQETASTRYDILQWAFQQFPDATENTANINVTLSNAISLDRTITDTRPDVCNNLFNVSHSHPVSVIIVFHNEALTVLLRTVHSVINRTPSKALLEIILVDDNSTFAFLNKALPVYVNYLPKVRIIRNSVRQGLIRSRNIGALNANGEILVFLDAHMECNQGWLEPLLSELLENPKGAVQPSVDIIDAKTLAYYKHPGPLFRGGFGWDLRYSWFKVPDYIMKELKSPAEPFPTPVLVGCAIAINKRYFYSIRMFDDGLNIWGGEHFDLSFRIWLCGGRILTAPCSRVGHYFKPFSYSFGNVNRELVIKKNLMRVSEIWMDEYKHIFYSATQTFGVLPRFSSDEIETMKGRKELRKNLLCKSFKWYLENVIPELKLPPKNAVYFGEVTNLKTDACFTVLKDGYIGITNQCYMHRIIPENYFHIDDKHRLKYDSYCVVVHPQYHLLVVRPCFEKQKKQPDFMLGNWYLVPGPLTGQLKLRTHTGDEFCVTHVTNIANKHKNEQMAQVLQCYSNSSYQIWSFSYKFAFPIFSTGYGIK